jgi:chaperonin GroEL
MSKQIYTKEQMSDAIAKGMSSISSITARTLGPGGLPILLERQGISPDGTPLPPIITKDGVTVAMEWQASNPAENLVGQTVKAICGKTNGVAGDGTTTAIVLGQAILAASSEYLRQDPGMNPQLLRESVELASKKVIEQLQTNSKKIEGLASIEAVATISANGDRDVGKVIREAFEAVGAEGVITVDEGYSNHTTISIVEGYQFRRGAESADRFFNNQEKTKFEAEHASVILYDGKLSSHMELLPALNAALEAANPEIQPGQAPKVIPPIVVVANEFTPEVLLFLVMQRAQGGLSFCAVKSPHTTSVRTAMLDDLAIALGGSRMGNGNPNLASIKASDVGFARKIVVDKYTTTFYEGDGTEEAVLERLDQLKASRKVAESPYDAALISDRMAALSNGIAKIGVGGSTDLEIKERYHRIEDALNAARAAVEEGVVPGGGTALLRLAEELGRLPAFSATPGEQVLFKALQAPFYQILENIGANAQMIKEVMLQEDVNRVYDARNRKIVDAFEAGIIDPVKVVRIALENATSIATLLSTCGGGIAFAKEGTSL